MKALLIALPLLGSIGWQACVAADLTERDVVALENQCEQAREAKLKPLRDAEIAQCKTQNRNDPEYCERYFRDYGDASKNASGVMKPRLFDDLPECVAALKARQGLVRN